MVVPVGADVAMLVIVRDPRRPRRGRRLGRPGGHRAYGSSGMWLLLFDTNDAAHLARLLECRGCSQATPPPTSVAAPLPARAGTGCSAPNEPIVVIAFFLGAMVIKKSMR